MAGEWEVVTPANNDGWEPVINAPAGAGIPHIDPQTLINQNEAIATETKNAQRSRMMSEYFKQRYGPGATIAYQAGNEIAQPVFGAIDLVTPGPGGPMTNISNSMQDLSNKMADARPYSSMVGTALPYMATGPIATNAYMKAISKLHPGFWQRTLSRPLMSSVIPGAVEGGTIAGLNPHQNALTGAAAGAAGNYIGQRAFIPLSAKPTNLSGYDQGMVKIADDWGISLLPGAKSGLTGMKQVDASLLKNAKSRDTLNRYTGSARDTLTKKVLKVAGMNADHVEPGDLWKHTKKLGKEYDKLEKISKPTFTNKTADDLLTSRAAYEDLSPADNTKWIDTQEARFLRMIRNGNEITLDSYRGMKNELTQHIDNLTGKPLGEEAAARKSVYMDQLQILRDMMKHGSNDPKIMAKWDKLNSEYRASMLLGKNDLLDKGYVDTNKLYHVLKKENPTLLHSMDPNNKWVDMSKAANLGRYIQDSLDPTLGGNHTINQLMGMRGGKGGFMGTLNNMSADSKFLPDAFINWYAWSNPRKGLLRLPQTAPLMGGNIGSAGVRGTSLMDDQLEITVPE